MAASREEVTGFDCNKPTCVAFMGNWPKIVLIRWGQLRESLLNQYPLQGGNSKVLFHIVFCAHGCT